VFLEAMSTKRRAVLNESMLRHIRQFIAGSILFNQQVADENGLRLTDMQCLSVLELLGPSTPGKLAEHTRLSSGGVTVMLDRLEKAGYVKRAPNPEDRRSILVSVNLKRLKKFQAYYDRITQQTVEVFEATPEAELEAVERFFGRINAIRVERGPLE
jgi:MarR family transcriptional regulator, organic hydroperoxide resistance regulator